MWKKILICMALCVCLLGAISVCAEETVDFAAFINADGVAVIPAEINGEAVTTIPEKAFMNNADLKEVVIPSSVTSISAYAFSGCANLTSVTFSDNIQTIGINAFSNCAALERLDKMPSALQSVAEYSFMGCKGLKSVVFGENLKSISFAAFASCKSLEYVYLPASVENIASAAFVGCESLTRVDLPEKLIRLNNDTFAGCTNLKTIVIHGMETTVGASAVSSAGEVDIYAPLGSAAYTSLTATESRFHSVLTIETLPTLTPLHLPDGILARVGAQEITKDDLLFYIADKLYDDMREIYNLTLFTEGWEEYEVKSGVTAREYLLEAGLDEAHRYLAIKNYAEANGLYTDEDAQAKVLDMVENDYGGEEAFEEMLADYYSVDAAKKYLESVGAIYAISYDLCSEEDAAKDFEENYICAKHILIQFSDDVSEDEVLAQSTEIYNKAVAGENFESLIGQYDTDVGQDVERGYIFTEGELVDEFYKAALALEVGEISKPVRTDYGYHVIKRYALPKKGTEMYDTYVENLRLTAGMNYVTENIQSWMEEYPLEIDKDALGKVDLSVFTITK